MKIKIYSTTYEHSSDYVRPFVASVLAHEPGALLTIVDNGSPEPIPPIEGVKVKYTPNMAAMSSFNVAVGKSVFDWVMFTDTDVICNGPFLTDVEQFDPAFVYGQQFFTEGSLVWFDSWLCCISRQVWDKVGKFDDDFKVTGAFQDLDYCIRAKAAGFDLRQCALAFKHLGANTTHRSPNFWENREYNRGLILSKHGIKLMRP